MASWFSRFNPVNSFPEYHGEYAVGTVDVEIPVSDLPAPCEIPDGASPTIAFRMFYPCVTPSSGSDRPVRWIPQPQRLTVAALLKFLSLSERKAGWLSQLTQQFYWININAHRNASLLKPPTSHGRWPVTFFSHGLAGSRNAYSYICGDLASHGTVVIALDHRDGSSPVQYVRATPGKEAHTIDAVKISHEPSDAVWEARDKQLRIRLWEMSVAYEALMKIGAGEKVENMDDNTSSSRRERIEVLQRFEKKLDVERAGKVSWAGHSFGACTVAQLLKSVYYSRDRPEDAGKPLIKLNEHAAILRQIMPESPAMLLDMWGLPFQSPQQKYLWEKPMPSYAVGGPQGANIVSIVSEGFANWKGNLNINKHVIAAPSRSRRPSAAPRLSREPGKLLPQWAKLRDESPSRDSGYASENSPAIAGSLSREQSADQSVAPSTPEQDCTTPGPHMFYVGKSQHFSQSDFGILFPWITRRITKAEEPERILELNCRAMVQTMRLSGVEMSGKNDEDILLPDGNIRRWVSIPVHDEEGFVGKTLQAVDRKLSGPAAEPTPVPKDDIVVARTKVEIES